MGYDKVKAEVVPEFRDVFVALLTGLPLEFGVLLFELNALCRCNSNSSHHEALRMTFHAHIYIMFNIM